MLSSFLTSNAKSSFAQILGKTSLLPNSRPQAIEFNVYVFVPDGGGDGGDYTSAILQSGGA